MTIQPRALILCAALSLSGCATVFWRPTTRLVSVTSDPPGARIFVAGADSGVTPRALAIRTSRTPLDVRFEKTGFNPVTHRIIRKPRPVVFLNVLPAFFNGVVAAFSATHGGNATFLGALVASLALYTGVDYLTGQMWRLPTDRVQVTLPARASALAPATPNVRTDGSIAESPRPTARTPR